MAKYCLKKPSKRLKCATKYKIGKKIRDHHKKLQKQKNKKKMLNHTKSGDIYNVPNKCPFKEEMLQKLEIQRENLKKVKENLKQKRITKCSIGEKRKLDNSAKNVAEVATDAAARGSDFTKKQKCDELEDQHSLAERNTNLFASEVRKTVENSDVVIEVLDARDPLGSRNQDVEDMVLKTGKRLVLLMNKIDLIPRENLVKWLTYLRSQLPAIAFKASTQHQTENLARVRSSTLHTNSALCIGADLLMKLLGNYCRSKNIRTSISVGIVGYPNVGKSSVINSLKRKRVCNVGAIPGITKQVQEIELDKHIRLLDSPGVIIANKGQLDSAEIALKNGIRIERLPDPSVPVQAILRRCRKVDLLVHYSIAEFENCDEFLNLIAQKMGRLRKGGIPDIKAAAMKVLNDWNSGRLRYYTEPPEIVSSEEPSAIILNQFTAEFDLENLVLHEKAIFNELPTCTSNAVKYQLDVNADEKEDEKMDTEDGESRISPLDIHLEPESEKNSSHSLQITDNSQINRAIKNSEKNRNKRTRKIRNRLERSVDQVIAPTLALATLNDSGDMQCLSWGTI